MAWPRGGAAAWALAGGLFLAVVGCEQRGIEERLIVKGLEPVPAAPAGAGAAAGERREAAPGAASWPWELPPGWTVDSAARPMRLATLLAPAPSGPVEVAVTRFAGRVGGELANVNRWRGQMGLGEIGGDELEGIIRRFESPDFEGYETRIAGGEGVMLAAGVYEIAEDRTWFVRVLTTRENADAMEPEVLRFARSIAGGGEAGSGR